MIVYQCRQLSTPSLPPDAGFESPRKWMQSLALAFATAAAGSFA